ncbi:sodium-independent sulfate anion transporter isoform X1 [Drosophila persimilis]|uniref:sodium-independent sulfate anion transporter isoform X1 n=1 Tax=Drosophila persimilis TaxID=7234 RepID=UPI000F0943AD|nr:sodium-independent sulfate anion transporter isoform X1 [Drosophila persimilis]
MLYLFDWSTNVLPEPDLYRERLPNVCEAVGTKARSCCSMRSVHRFLPVTDWLPKYQLNFLPMDIVAGLTVGLTAVPQAIAYGVVADLPPAYGLYSAFMGGFVYILLGTCKDITVGPTAIMALMVRPYVNGNPDNAVLLCFLSGCIILLLGLLNLGVLMRFISVPVTTGFTMAAAITIASGQINNLFGISSSSTGFLDAWIHFFGHIKETRRNDVILGCCTLLLLLLMRKIKDLPCGYRSLLKYLSLSRNAVAVFVGILLCYLLSRGSGSLPFLVSGSITSGLPPFRPPPFHTQDPASGEPITFGGMVSNVGSALVSIPLLSILESVAVAKAFSKGKIVNASQEMIALGMSNVLSSFFLSMPITGSFTRSAINNASGVKTPLGGAVTGALVLMTLAILTSTFAYIPKATLAAIIIAAMLFMVEYETIAEIWRAKKRDMLPFLVTVLCCVFWTLEYGMVVGILFNALFLLYKSMKPQFHLETQKYNGMELSLADLKGSVDYSAAEYLKTAILSHVTGRQGAITLVVIKGDEIGSIDTTVALNLISLREDLALLDCNLICWNWSVPAAGVLCRMDSTTRQMLKFSKSFPELMESLEKESDSTVKISQIDD